MDLHALYDAHRAKAEFLTVYISEAHPDDEWQVESNRQDGFIHRQPQTMEQRQELARILVDRLKYRMPVSIDPLDGRAEKAFAAWPERIYVIDRGGRILYKGGMGPFGFDPKETESTLAALPAAVSAAGS